MPSVECDISHPYSCPTSVNDEVLAFQTMDEYDCNVVSRSKLVAGDLLLRLQESGQRLQLNVQRTLDIPLCIQLFSQSSLHEHVRVLTFYGPEAPGGSSVTGTTKADYSWMSDLLPLLRTLHHVEHLTLWDLSWGDVPVEVRQLIRTRFAGVRHLSVRAVDFWSSNQMMMVLQAFRHLRTMDLQGPYWHLMSHTPRQVACAAPLRLRTLQIDGVMDSQIRHDHTMLHWLQGNRESFNVEEVFMNMPIDMLEKITGIMPKLLPCMKTFRLQLYNRWWEDRGAGPSPVDMYPTLIDEATGLHNISDDMEALFLEDDELYQGLRTFPNASESAQVAKMYRTQQGRTALVLQAAAALELSGLSASSRLETITAVLRWSWISLDLLAIRFALWLINPDTRKVILALEVQSDHELESFPWPQLDAELCQAPLHIAAPFEFVLMMLVPSSPLHVSFSGSVLESMLPKFSVLTGHLGLDCRFNVVYDRSDIEEEERAEPIFENIDDEDVDSMYCRPPEVC